MAQLILNGMRVQLHKIVSLLGKDAIGERTDSVYTVLTREEAMARLDGFKFKLTGGSNYNDIGSLRFQEGCLPEGGCISVDPKSTVNPRDRAFNNQKQLHMNNEFDDEEAREILEQKGPLLIVGKYPGTGKSNLALHWAQSKQDGEMLVACPTNVLCDEITKQGYKAITVHTLLGRRPQGAEDGENFQPFNVSEYNIVLFEEIFFNSVYQLEWIRNFMNQHDKKTFIANGDPAQNEPVGQNLNVEFDGYYNEILAYMFARRLNLKISKRYTPEDRERMEMLYYDLLHQTGDVGASPTPFKIASRYLNIVNWEELKLDNGEALHPHVAFTNDSVDRINDWAQNIRHGRHEWHVGYVAIGSHIREGSEET